MKKYLFLLVVVFGLSSCTSLLQSFGIYENKTSITNYEDQMRLLKINFPEVYDLYRQGQVIIDEVFTYGGESGDERVHVSYRYR